MSYATGGGSRTPGHGADDLLAAVIPPHKRAIAVTTLDSDGQAQTAASHALDRYFEFGSLTKALTGTLLAALAVTGTVELDASVGSILGGVHGEASDVRLIELATHTSGLPRLAPNAMRLPFWPRDPYRFFTENRLHEGLRFASVKNRGDYAYSNFGFQVLGLCLATVAHRPFNQLIRNVVFDPIGMTAARCQPCSDRGLHRGRGEFITGGRWHTRVPGDGGVDGTIADLVAFCRANLRPETTPLRDATYLAQAVHHRDESHVLGLGWHHTSDGIGLWHNGATGRYQSMVIIQRERGGVGAIAAHGATNDYRLDDVVTVWARRFLAP